MTLDEILEYYARGCEWYGTHPECFSEEGTEIKIIGEVPEEAKYYVMCLNEEREKAKARKALGLGPKLTGSEIPVKVW